MGDIPNHEHVGYTRRDQMLRSWVRMVEDLYHDEPEGHDSSASARGIVAALLIVASEIAIARDPKGEELQ